MSPLRLRVWVLLGSFGYWKVVDNRGEALMTALDSEGTARRWAQQDVPRLHNGRRYYLDLQEGTPE